MNAKGLLWVAAAMVAAQSWGKLETSRIFSSNMVLQRDKPVPVWGKAAPGEKVTVSFADQSVAATADDKGAWRATLKPLAASKENRALVVQGAAEKIEYANVLVGDVWVCSGQSNMEMSFSWGVYDGDKFKAEAAQFPTIRRIKIRKCTRNLPEAYDVPAEGAWSKACDTFQGCSATGWFFARKLVQELDVPIGLLESNWSGCRIEPFMSPESFKGDPSLKQFADALELGDPKTELGKKAWADAAAAAETWAAEFRSAVAAGKTFGKAAPGFPGANVPGGAARQYNWMIAPIVSFPVKGAIWYQGCSNGGEDESYLVKLAQLADGWRRAWGEELPFYWVQLASFTGATSDPAGGNGYARIRDAMRRALDKIPHGGMAVTIDVGNASDIHPKAKIFVGERLALWALAKDYGKNVVCTGPLFKKMTVEEPELEGDPVSVVLEFDGVGSGLMVGKKNPADNSPVVADPGAKLEGFALADADRKWHWADAKIVGKTVVLTCDQVKAPVAVRYAHRANPMGHCNLYNKEGLPASPFRTDNW
ncbi:MAG: sialate O-acetylesterase [Kiritimatiellae bacterium]|nr:sialate O-acetylesterase [Kiritimatiellia bacterium]